MQCCITINYATSKTAYPSHHPEAIKAFDKVIKIQPNNQYAYQGKGATYLRLGQFKLAKTDLDKSIQLDNSLSYAHYYRGLVNVALGNKDNANTDFDTAANLFEKEGKTKLAKLSREFKKHLLKTFTPSKFNLTATTGIS